jgi:hypothetical protein
MTIFLGCVAICGLVVKRSWLQIQRSGFDSWHYQVFWEVVGLKWGPLSLMSTIEELLGSKSSGSSLENWEYGRRDPPRLPRGTLYLQKLALTSPTSSGCYVGIVHSRTKATDFVFGSFVSMRSSRYFLTFLWSVSKRPSDYTVPQLRRQ